MRKWFSKLFPNLAAIVADWTVEKWIALPIVLWVVMGAIAGIGEAVLAKYGWYDELWAHETESWNPDTQGRSSSQLKF